jgi:hypothetical protein
MYKANVKPKPSVHSSNASFFQWNHTKEDPQHQQKFRATKEHLSSA